MTKQYARTTRHETLCASRQTTVWVGIDVASRKCDVAVYGSGEVFRIQNSAPGFQQLRDRLGRIPNAVIVLEATGFYHKLLLADLQKHQHSVAVVNPKQVRDFAKACGYLEKTDEIDATVIARFGHCLEPKVSPVLSENQQERSELIARRRQLVKQRTAEQNRLAQTISSDVKASIAEMIQLINQQIKHVEELLSQSLDECSKAKRLAELLTSVPGVGVATANTLISELPELGTVNRREAAKLIGVAPINNDSGTFRGNRSTRHGRTVPRSTLYMAALTATRFNPTIRHFYERLLQNGKPRKVAIVACMRKLIIILNQMIKNDSPWQPQYPTAT